jgi:hypothetical protein
MSIGVALVVIFILYLIDKHDQWRRAAFIAGGAVVLGILILGGWFSWTKYQDWRATKAREQVEAAQTTRDASTRACIAASLPAHPDIFDQVAAEDQCGKSASLDTHRLDQMGCQERLMKQVPYRDLPTGSVLGLAAKVCAQNSGGKWVFDSNTDQWRDSIKAQAEYFDCFNKKTGKKEDDLGAQFGGVITSCGPNYLQKPAGQCREIAASNDRLHAPNCVSSTVIDLSAGAVPKQ